MSAHDPHWAQVKQLQDIKQILEQQQQAIENLTKMNKIIALRLEMISERIKFLEENAHA